VVTSEILNWVLFVILVAVLLVKAYALIDAVVRKPALYQAADKQSKTLWVVILAVSLGLQLLLQSAIQPLNLIGTVAACVYLADVRPALRGLRRY
jgi:hypothetical protein